jgi:hypothetical protein
MTWDIIQENKYWVNWDYTYLSANPTITWDMVEADQEMYRRHEWDYDILSINHNISFDIVDAHTEIDWCYTGLSKNCMKKYIWHNLRTYPYILK